MATVPVFLGWWHLGRNVSMSPIETAKAFGALGLNIKDPHANAQGILEEIGDQEVRYDMASRAMLTGNGLEAQEKRRTMAGEPQRVRNRRDGTAYLQ